MALELAEEKQAGNQPNATGDRLTQLKERVSRIDSFVKQAAALVTTETRRTDEIRRSLEDEVSSLETELEEKEATLQKKDSALRELEERLNARIRDLESRLREKEQILEQRETGLNDLRSGNEEGGNSANEKIPQLEEIMANWELAMAALALQFRRTEGELIHKGSALREMEENVAEMERIVSAQINELGKRIESLSQKG